MVMALKSEGEDRRAGSWEENGRISRLELTGETMVNGVGSSLARVGDW